MGVGGLPYSASCVPLNQSIKRTKMKIEEPKSWEDDMSRRISKSVNELDVLKCIGEILLRTYSDK